MLAQAPRLAKARAGAPVFGLHHFANAGEVSWKGFAEGVFDLALGPAAPKVEAIATAGRTNQIGDGKIFVLELEAATRIRTGENGPSAL